MEEEQWNDFKDDTTVDVSNLKITKLNIEEEDDNGCGDGSEDGKDSSGENKKDGVWKIEEKKSLETVICDVSSVGIEIHFISSLTNFVSCYRLFCFCFSL